MQLNTKATFDFINILCKKIKNLNKNILLIGEQDPFYSSIYHETEFLKSLDSIFNFNFAYSNNFSSINLKNLLSNNNPQKILFTNNHDVERNRYGEEDIKIAKIIGLILLTKNNSKIIIMDKK